MPRNNNGDAMSIGEFRSFLNLMMCSDPWPITTKAGDTDHRRMIEFADRKSRELGYSDWIDAYHRLLKGTVKLSQNA